MGNNTSGDKPESERFDNSREGFKTRIGKIAIRMEVVRKSERKMTNQMVCQIHIMVKYYKDQSSISVLNTILNTIITRVKYWRTGMVQSRSPPVYYVSTANTN